MQSPSNHDELVSIGQGNRKDSGSTKGMQVGNKCRNFFIPLSSTFLTLICVSALLTEMDEEDSNGQRDDDVELLRRFKTS